MQIGDSSGNTNATPLFANCLLAECILSGRMSGERAAAINVPSSRRGRRWKYEQEEVPVHFFVATKTHYQVP